LISTIDRILSTLVKLFKDKSSFRIVNTQ